MGTRGLIGFVSKGGKRKGTYNHYDSYPSGLGVDIMRFIKGLSGEQIKQMAVAIENLEWPEDPATVSGAKGAHVLDDILTGRVKALRDDTDFADDHLFCEWCYWIDFENRTLRVQSNSRFKPAIIDETRPFAELGTRFLVWLDWLGTEWESDRGEADEIKRKRAEAMGMTDEERDKLLDGLVVEYGKKRGLPTF